MFQHDAKTNHRSTMLINFSKRELYPSFPLDYLNTKCWSLLRKNALNHSSLILTSSTRNQICSLNDTPFMKFASDFLKLKLKFKGLLERSLEALCIQMVFSQALEEMLLYALCIIIQSKIGTHDDYIKSENSYQYELNAWFWYEHDTVAFLFSKRMSELKRLVKVYVSLCLNAIAFQNEIPFRYRHLHHLDCFIWHVGKSIDLTIRKWMKWSEVMTHYPYICFFPSSTPNCRMHSVVCADEWHCCNKQHALSYLSVLCMCVFLTTPTWIVSKHLKVFFHK